MGFAEIRYEVADGVALVTLARPEKLNAVTATTIGELVAAFDTADADDTVRAVIVTGAGRAFCAGADLSAGGTTFVRAAHGRAEPADLHEDGGGRVTLRIFDMKKPVIAAINGPAVGFGITLTLPMDVRIASTAARIGFVFTRRGVVPEACSTWFLPRLVGPSQAAEWVLTGRVFDGEEARAGGLVSRVVAPEALLPTARELAPAKHGGPPPTPRGHWLLVQDQKLVVVPEGGGFRLPTGELPTSLDGVVKQPLWLGTYGGTPCWVAGLPPDAALPEAFHRETLVPMQGTRLPDELLSLGGMAMQLLYWESTSGHCPRCGTPAERMAGEWGKRCPTCHYEHYPHLHPAVIVLVRDGDRVLLARKAIWAPGRYALVAGFVDNGESLEAALAREARQEVGVDVKDIRYVGSQNWPFPSQLMVGFVAAYAGGAIAIDRDELEDARWFSRAELPDGPSRHSIAGWILANFARR